MTEIVLLMTAFMVCNVIYCGQRVIRDIQEGRMNQSIWGMIALLGALAALIAMAWATLASFAHY